VEENLRSKSQLNTLVVSGFLVVLDLGTSDSEHLVRPVVEVEFGLSWSIGRKALFEAVSSIIKVVLGRGEAEPGLVHGKTDLTLTGKKFRVVLHHALKAGRGLELGALSIGVLRVNKFGNHTTSLLEVIDVFGNFEQQGIGVTREMRVTLVVGDITVFVPLGSQKGVKLVVLNVNNKLFASFILVNETADGTHGFTGLSWDSN